MHLKADFKMVVLAHDIEQILVFNLKNRLISFGILHEDDLLIINDHE